MDRRIAVLLAVALWIADRLLKYLIISGIIPSPLFSGWGIFNLNLYQNKNLVFSLPLYFPRLMLLVVFIIIIILCKLLIEAWQISPHKIILALLLILAGAISNFIDRLLYGFVIDYLAFFGRSYLNLADLMIAAGVLILLSVKFKK